MATTTVRGTDDAYLAKLAALREVIDLVGPDVLALQEVGPAEVLVDLNEACAVDFDFRLTGTPTVGAFASR